jgi:type I restriction enzyme S subunit
MSLTGNPGRVAFIGDEACALNQRVACLRAKNTTNSFLYYLFNNKAFESIAFANSTGGAQKNLSTTWLNNYKIPIPSIEEQARIVGILDTFTASIDNLKEQIAHRRKQYEYYRDQLLDLERKEGVEMKTIKEVFDTRNGYTPSTSNELFWNDGIIPWFKMEDIRDNGRILSDSYLHITPQAVKGKGLFKANSIILATSATIGEHALILVEFLSNQRFTNIALKEKFAKSVDMKYIYYYMFIIDEWCKQHVNQGGFASVDMTGLYNLPIPLPSLQEQQRIVSILDTFEASIQNLEAQLSQREKQYEYYRNKLLTFE